MVNAANPVIEEKLWPFLITKIDCHLWDNVTAMLNYFINKNLAKRLHDFDSQAKCQKSKRN